MRDALGSLMGKRYRFLIIHEIIITKVTTLRLCILRVYEF